MNRYYKTNKDTETGLNIQALLDRADVFDKQVEILREKYGFTRVWASSFYFRNLSAVEFEGEPDMSIWKKVRDIDGGYYPRSRSKNKEVLNDFTELKNLEIKRDELDDIIGNKRVFAHAGFKDTIPDIYIFIVGSDWGCKIPEDCEEISNIEYEKLLTKKE